jgi:hypothetical protein
MIDSTDFYSVGYFLIRQNKPNWPQLTTDLLPPKLISLSDCLCPRLLPMWGWTPGDRVAAANFGIPEVKLGEFVQWCHTGQDPNGMFSSVDEARHFIQRFLPSTSDLYLIEVGFPRELESEYWQYSDSNLGIDHRLKQHILLESGGKALGFEIISRDSGTFSHSWLCSGLEQNMVNLYNIRPNSSGLIDSYDDAKKVYVWIAEDHMQGHRAEPEPYDIWLLISYPLMA